ncbi:flagellar biosynthesis protein FlgT [Pseudoalteromonas luteoviolacea]|uniref:Flagellar biosynthesis protein FlgT n=1 Tax=Pseudoalteromonas luteoviolacea TaxID=43657 RepID=A0A1C0TK23_9GAMM|nr:flagellar assembly protein T N-terminal domain-containing protein [Pseudoalteromonas luteoviolacea]MBQ4813991.1 flagellar assembly protein T N-terminal domain-containing protein [Pseudoalteromonas luteoviolacea]OCQ18930.1 flagellar biosynthesis protein FlgT [Pseudoalteromonas luteoviolacea]
MNKLSCLALVTGALSLPCKAEWFEVTGYANAYTSDRAAARQEAVQDAITQALIFSGATVSSVQTLADGVLAQDHIKIKSHGEIQEINLVSENTKDGVMSVTLHLDIFPKQQKCPEESFSKQITVTQSQLIQPHQARLGQIFDIHKSSSERLYQTLMQRNMTVKPIPFIDKSLNVRAFFSQNFDYDKQLIESLTATSNSQYVLLSQITDLASTQQLNSDYAFWQDDEYVRSFKIDFVAFDALTKDKVWQQHYSVTGIWPFEKTKIIDVYSDTFWHTDYGKRIQSVFNSLAQDLDQAFACMPTKGKILHKDQDQLVINLGRAHGIKEGQVLSVAHRSDVAGERNQFFSRSIQTINRVKVTQVNAQNAIAQNIQSRPMNNIQVNDIVELIITPPEDFAL